jgi:CDP-paratose 2-epimerase
MRILVTGGCGFTGFSLLRFFAESSAGSGTGYELIALDSLTRAGSEQNRQKLASFGVKFIHADLRSTTDIDALPVVDWVIDAAACPSVMAGIDGRTSSRQLVEHNLLGTINLLEYCKRHRAGFILLSTSRVYSIADLNQLPIEEADGTFRLSERAGSDMLHVSSRGVTESFSVDPPVSLYGSTKRTSEILALEYGAAFDFPVWLSRCGLLAGPGQFGRPDQGIVSFWIHSWQSGRTLRYIGFGGQGHQVRDCLHTEDLARLVQKQLTDTPATDRRIFNVSGGAANAFSLKQLSDWCCLRFGDRSVDSVQDTRGFDVPWLILDSSPAMQAWDWSPQISREAIFEQVGDFAEQHPEWLSEIGV